MTWIHNQWDKGYIATAERKIRELVSLFIRGCPKGRRHSSSARCLNTARKPLVARKKRKKNHSWTKVPQT